MAGGDFWGGKLIETKESEAFTVSARIEAVVAAAVTHLTRPANKSYIAIQVLSNGFWLKPGYHPDRSLVDSDITTATNVIADTAHGFTSGDGPYQMTVAAPAISGTPGIVLSTGPELLTRDAGDFVAEGFAVNQLVTLGGSASNDGVLTIVTVTTLGITVAETITPEGSQTDLTLTATVELPGALALLTDYYVGVVDANNYTLHTSQSEATAGKNSVDINLPFMTLLTSVVIDDGPPGTWTRTVGSWITDGFVVGEDFIVSGSASNEGVFTPTVVTALVMTVVDTLTIEGAQTDLVISAQLPGGVHSIAAMPSADPTATNTDGQAALHLTSDAGKGGAVVKVLAMPATLTVRGDNAGSKMVYYYLA